MSLTFTSNATYSSRYLTFLGNREDFYQPQFAKFDLGVSLNGPDDRWQLSITGRNIFDKLTTGNCSAPDAQGGVIAAVSGLATTPPSGKAEVSCRIDRGRAIWMTATFRPFK